ncbi:hypothetical protein N7532_001226 [Penicillium argentinense]|uniref:Uncharacterized protein n=1 Tax=Penicillium argentinense TaxID=1131581 RepID=A0A9W9G2B1_9EURO|nr:uncharacterized protein N7532_001226 [Penicillium argentinense]KAJ5110691.1 hypothetical protein N7532_001226 [Penicillium argentinense]
MAEGYELINHESNIMMLEYGAHKEFGEFHFVLEATPVMNQYRIKSFPNVIGLTMAFMPANGLVHIGNFIHMMGMGEKLDKLTHDYDGCAGLAPSGSTDVAALLALRGLSLLSPNTFAPRSFRNVERKHVDENEEGEHERVQEEMDY